MNEIHHVVWEHFGNWTDNDGQFTMTDPMNNKVDTNLLNLQINTPKDQIVCRFFTSQMWVFCQECLAVLVATKHAKLLQQLFVFLCELILRK